MTAEICFADVEVMLNSGGGPAAYADLRLADGSTGRGSAPVAIKPGRRERPRSEGLAVGAPVPAHIAREVTALQRAGLAGQEDVDAWLGERSGILGTDVTLALSLAHARAAARSSGRSLVHQIADLAGTRPSAPGLLVAAVSGGIHQGAGIAFQQIMLATAADLPSRLVPKILDVYARLETRLFDGGHGIGYSASSGILVEGLDAAAATLVVREVIEDAGMSGALGIAIDVAAEHLHDEKGYHLDGRHLDAERMIGHLLEVVDRHPVVMIEDPLIAEHTSSWRVLTRQLRDRVVVVGDDLFASQAEYLDPALAHGVLLKMNQVGTVSGTALTAVSARTSGMVCAVSHRSHETEDTAVCDLAVALGARWIKIGGPRRGDRVEKYNRLLRLERDGVMLS